MGFYLKTPLTNDLKRSPPFQPVGPKTHTPASLLQHRGQRFYTPETGQWLFREGEIELIAA